MSAVCFYFQVHQPLRVKPYRVFDIGHDHQYFNDSSETDLNNKRVLRKVTNKCYLPTNEVLYKLLKRHPEFKVSFSISGIALEQFEAHEPRVIESFKKLVRTGRVEMLAETYYHSLASLYSPKEFARQVHLHRQKIFDLFGIWPSVFRNTELIYSNAIAAEVGKLGFTGMLMEGADHVLEWRSPNFVYTSNGGDFALKLLLKNYKLSDDIAFRFSEKSWAGYPLEAPSLPIGFPHTMELPKLLTSLWITKHLGNINGRIPVFLTFYTTFRKKFLNIPTTHL